MLKVIGVAEPELDLEMPESGLEQVSLYFEFWIPSTIPFWDKRISTSFALTGIFLTLCDGVGAVEMMEGVLRIGIEVVVAVAQIAGFLPTTLCPFATKDSEYILKNNAFIWKPMPHTININF